MLWKWDIWFWRCCDKEQVAALIYRVLVPNKQGGSFSNDGTRYVLKVGYAFKNPYGDINQKFTMFPEEVLTFNEFRVLKVMKIIDRKLL